MSTDYEAITKHNERQLGVDTASRKTQVCMYSDLTHFIYEILQNADDYGATEIVFRLTRTELAIEHNGRQFLEENVKAITYFGKSTSRTDLVKTGRFGVGFKSVFAFTATPIIHSGDEHFRIHGLYRVEVQPRPDDLPGQCTRIVLPFNHEGESPDYVEDLMSAKEAYKKIGARLTGLNMNTLLFTSNLREIRWEVDGRSGHYSRQDTIRNESRRTTITEGDAASEYLVFSKTPSWQGEEYGDVDVAYALDEQEQLSPVQDFLYVLFPTTQETRLQFLVNGPYRTNPSRETISEEDRFNRHLLEVTAKLLRSTLTELKGRDLLTVKSLAVMPNASDSLREFYRPLLEAVVEEFQSNELVPTDAGDFVNARNALLGPAPIRKVVTNAEIGFLSEREDARWAKGVTQSTRPDLFLKGLGIEEWGWQEFENVLKSKYGWGYLSGRDSAMAWLKARPYPWLQSLYLLLADGIAKDDLSEWQLGFLKIVRVEVDGRVTHVDGRSAYFPKRGGYADLPQVHTAVLKGRTQAQERKIEKALQALGVNEIGDEERVDLLLERHYGGEEVRVSSKKHLEHMKLFIKWWKMEKSASKFQNVAIFRVAGSSDLAQADECYLDEPLRKTGLGVIHQGSHRGVPYRHKLSTTYKKLSGEEFCDFAVACGVVDRIAIRKQACQKHPNESALRCDYNRYGVKYTKTAINSDWVIEDLPALLKIRNKEVNRLIWETIRKADPRVLEAAFRPNQRYRVRKQRSSLVLALSQAEWIPDKRGHFKRPSAISKEELHSSFRYDDRNGWLSAMGFGAEARKASAEYALKKEHAEALGVPIDIVEQFSGFSKKDQPELWSKIKVMLKREEQAKAESVRQSAPFDEALASAFDQEGAAEDGRASTCGRTARNPGRRRRRLEGEISESIASEGDDDTRLTVGLHRKWKGKNDQVRAKLLHWYAGKCQICGRTFLQRNGESYFEGIYLVSYTEAKWIDRPGSVLCLCPWHSAMWKFGKREAVTDILAGILDFVPKAEGGMEDAVLSLRLCDERVDIQFHEDHFIELQTMTRESKRARLEAASGSSSSTLVGVSSAGEEAS